MVLNLSRALQQACQEDINISCSQSMLAQATYMNASMVIKSAVEFHTN